MQMFAVILKCSAVILQVTNPSYSQEAAVIPKRQQLVPRGSSYSQEAAVIPKRQQLFPIGSSYSQEAAVSPKRQQLFPRGSSYSQEAAVIPKRQQLFPRGSSYSQEAAVIPKRQQLFPIGSSYSQEAAVSPKRQHYSQEAAVIPKRQQLFPIGSSYSQEAAVIPKRQQLVPRGSSYSQEAAVIPNRQQLFPRGSSYSQEAAVIPNRQQLFPRGSSYSQEAAVIPKRQQLFPRGSSYSQEAAVIPKRQQLVPRGSSYSQEAAVIPKRQQLFPRGSSYSQEAARFGRLVTARSSELMRAIKVSMERHRNERAGGTGDPRKKKKRRPATSSSTISTCEDPGVAQPGIEPGASRLTAQPPRFPRPREYDINISIDRLHHSGAKECGCKMTAPFHTSAWLSALIWILHFLVAGLDGVARSHGLRDTGLVAGIVAACDEIRNMRGIFQRVRQNLVRRCHAAAVDEWLDCAPPAYSNRDQSPSARPLPDFCKWESCRTMLLVAGYSRGSPVYPTLAFRRCFIFTSIALIGFQNLAVGSPPPPPNVITNLHSIPLCGPYSQFHFCTVLLEHPVLSCSPTLPRTFNLRTRIPNAHSRPIQRRTNSELVIYETSHSLPRSWQSRLLPSKLLGRDASRFPQLKQRDFPRPTRTVPNCPLSSSAFACSLGEFLTPSSRWMEATGSTPGEDIPGFSHVGIVLDHSSGRRIFSGISRFSRPYIPALLHSHFSSPSSALETSMLRATQISPLHSNINIYYFYQRAQHFIHFTLDAQRLQSLVTGIARRSHSITHLELIVLNDLETLNTGAHRGLYSPVGLTQNVLRTTSCAEGQTGVARISIALSRHASVSRDGPFVNSARASPVAGDALGILSFAGPRGMARIRTRIQRYDGNTARLARRSDEALGVRGSVARIALSFLDLARGGSIALLNVFDNVPTPLAICLMLSRNRNSFTCEYCPRTVPFRMCAELVEAPTNFVGSKVYYNESPTSRVTGSYNSEKLLSGTWHLLVENERCAVVGPALRTADIVWFSILKTAVAIERVFRSEKSWRQFITDENELGEKDTNDINNKDSARLDNSDTERMTRLPQFIPELYEEVDNSTQQRYANVAIASSSHATPRDETNAKQQRHNQRKTQKSPRWIATT
ncbi:hypothetical protein PR048_030780 [Dryococelus australis]|uniref:Uncharacterized protein n=1 Tax=Dryococelus australis TaxID=614101 RepID=A0ABQ9GAB4_9NEOP|nr:hypothetical protein PR048_030780 [Dryococelus australis]